MVLAHTAFLLCQGFTYGDAGGKERNTIEPKNMMSWPVTHAQEHGFLRLGAPFLKLLCLMFESGRYELGLTLVSSAYGGVRAESRLESLHLLNLPGNHGLAADTELMRRVVCGTPSYEEAQARDRAAPLLHTSCHHAPVCLSAMHTRGRRPTSRRSVRHG